MKGMCQTTPLLYSVRDEFSIPQKIRISLRYSHQLGDSTGVASGVAELLGVGSGGVAFSTVSSS